MSHRVDEASGIIIDINETVREVRWNSEVGFGARYYGLRGSYKIILDSSGNVEKLHFYLFNPKLTLKTSLEHSLNSWGF